MNSRYQNSRGYAPRPVVLHAHSTMEDIQTIVFTSQDPQLTLAAARGEHNLAELLARDKAARPNQGASPAVGKALSYSFLA